jgi:hydrogenase maturation protease
LSKKVAVIGIGNTLRRDDGIGMVILESLLKFYQREEVEYFNFGTASFDLLHRLQKYATALLIDGIDARLAAGQLKVFALKDADYNFQRAATSTHELNLRDIFTLSRKLNLKTKIYVAGIQVEDTSFGEGLSRVLEEKKEEIAREISTFIDEVLLKSAV